MNIHQDRISGRHSALDKVLLTEIEHFVKLGEASDLSCRDSLFAANAFGLLIISIRDTFLHENATCLENGRFPLRGYHGCIKDMLFGQSR